eukprot:jgi/Orpsp1_1/1186195/evm.model.d7180000048809.1
METTRDVTNNVAEEAAQIKPENNNNGGGWFSFFRRNNNTQQQQDPEAAKLVEPKTKTEEKEKPENVTINVEPEVVPSTSKPVRFNEINLYEDEPSLKDIPLDVYDDSIKLEPQNPKNANYQSINNANVINDNINNIDLYESTPEAQKTIFQKIKEMYRETIRLIKLCIKSIFAFIWAIIGGTITGIFAFFRRLFFNTLCSIVKHLIRSKLDNKKAVRINEFDNEEEEDIWNINSMLITKPLYNLA